MVGVISDTHGSVHPGVFRALQGVDLILHAGDIGPEDVIVELESIAPVTAVKGNCDYLPVERFPVERVLDLSGVKVMLRHIPPADALDAAGVRVVVHGHTHLARNEEIQGTLFFNPGYGGRTRGVTSSVGLLELGTGGVRARIVEL